MDLSSALAANLPPLIQDPTDPMIVLHGNSAASIEIVLSDLAEYDGMTSQADGGGLMPVPTRPALPPVLPTPPVGGPRPVLQLLSAPLSIDTSHYANALTEDGHDGDLRALRAFRDLVDPLPSFTSYYFATGSTEATYCQVLRGASADAGDILVQGMIASCLKELSNGSLPNLGGVPGSWLPVYATPVDWAEKTNQGLFGKLDLDLSNPGAGGAYAVIGQDDGPDLQAGGRKLKGRDAAQSGHLQMRYLMVQLRRPWLNPALFHLTGWRLGKQPAGCLSSGDLNINPGLMPLLPWAVLLGKDITFEAEWTPTAQQMIDAAPIDQRSFGPIPLDPSPANSTTRLHVIAWISALTPFSPSAS